MLENEDRELEKIRTLFSELEAQDIILTVGNPLREDDGVGYYIYNGLIRKSSLRAKVFHTDQNPSMGINLVEQHKSKRLLYIDAADFAGHPGEIRLITSNEVGDTFLSTHEIPISVIGEGIRSEYGCEVYYVGIQVKSLGYGSFISREVLDGAEKIVELWE